VSATEAKAKLLALLDGTAAGEEFEITRHGRTVARLVPAAVSDRLRGSAVGIARTAADDDELFTAVDASEWELD
jgi:prevent-host-death family protein